MKHVGPQLPTTKIRVEIVVCPGRRVTVVGILASNVLLWGASEGSANAWRQEGLTARTEGLGMFEPLFAMLYILSYGIDSWDNDRECLLSGALFNVVFPLHW